jgi:hypothetical protein
MADFSWREQVGTLSGMLDSFEADAAPGAAGSPGLEEFKSALDDLRLRAWGLLTAANSGDPHGFQERFRTRRGIDFCRSLSSDLQTGKLSNREPQLPELAAASGDLAATVKKMTQVKKATQKTRKPKRKGSG